MKKRLFLIVLIALFAFTAADTLLLNDSFTAYNTTRWKNDPSDSVTINPAGFLNITRVGSQPARSVSLIDPVSTSGVTSINFSFSARRDSTSATDANQPSFYIHLLRNLNTTTENATVGDAIQINLCEAANVINYANIKNGGTLYSFSNATAFNGECTRDSVHNFSIKLTTINTTLLFVNITFNGRNVANIQDTAGFPNNYSWYVSLGMGWASTVKYDSINLWSGVDSSDAGNAINYTINDTRSGAFALFQGWFNITNPIYSLRNFTFEYDGGNGTLQNQSTGSFTGYLNRSFALRTLNTTIGSIVRWRFWANTNLSVRIATPLNTFQISPIYSVTSFTTDRANYSEGQTANVSILLGNLTGTQVNVSAYITINYTNGTQLTRLVYTTVDNQPTALLSTTFNIGENNASLEEWRNFSYFINTSHLISGVIINGTNTNTNATGNLTRFSYRILITNCSTPSVTNTTALNISVRDEETDASIENSTVELNSNGYLSISGSSYGRNFAFNLNLTGSSTQRLCIYPSWARYEINFSTVYYATNYAQRTYANNINITNTSQDLILYLLSSSLADQVIITVADQNNIQVSGATVSILRYFTGSNSYKTIASFVSDYEGKGTVNLRTNDVYYTIIISGRGLTNTVPNIIIVCTGSVCPPYRLTVYLATQEANRYFKQLNNLVYGCTFNPSSGVLSCTVIDTSGVTSRNTLNVDRKGALNFTSACSTSCESSACILTCSLGNVTGNVYRYRLVNYDQQGQGLLLIQDYLDYSSSRFTWGELGLFIAFLLLLVLFFVGAFNPSTAILLTFIGIVAGYYLELLPVTIGSLLGLGVVVIILIYKSKS